MGGVTLIVFNEAFMTTFLGNLAAAAVVAIPALTIWAFVSDSRRLTKRFCRRNSARLALRIRFMWLVLRRKRKKSEFRSWLFSERVRKFTLRLVSEGPKARSYSLAQLEQTMARAVTTFTDFDSVPAIDRLNQAAGLLSMKDYTTPLESKSESLSPSGKATWLKSQSLDELTTWALRLNDDDRDAWKSWLSSPKCVADLESTRSSSADK